MGHGGCTPFPSNEDFSMAVLPGAARGRPAGIFSTQGFIVRDDRNIGREGAEQAQADGATGGLGEETPAGAAGGDAQANGVTGEPERFEGDRLEAQASSGAEGEGVRGEERREEETEPEPVERAVADLERQLDEQRDKYLRLAAEFDNYRKRMARERQETSARAQGELVKRLLDSLDDLGRVSSVSADGASAQAIIEGVDAVRRKLMHALKGAGLEVLEPVDQPFNPELHEAVGTERALSREDDHLVSQVYQPGYVFQGQLLRPARVVVKQWADE